MRLVVCFPKPVDIFQEAAERLSAKVIPLFPWIIFRREGLVPQPYSVFGAVHAVYSRVSSKATNTMPPFLFGFPT